MLALNLAQKETGHFSRNSLFETIKLKNTRLVVVILTVFGMRGVFIFFDV
jgi:hypothetical protein